MTDEELIKHLRVGPEIFYRYVDVDHAAADRIEQLQAKLKASEEIGRAFEEDAGQLRAKLSKAVNVIKNLINLAPEGDEDEWHIALDDAAEALAEIKGET